MPKLKTSPDAPPSEIPGSNRFAHPKSLHFWSRPIWWVILGSLILLVIYARVVVLQPGYGVVGGNVDGFQNLWNDYWTRTALLSGRNPYFTDFIYYPIGTSLRFHTLHPLTTLIAIPAWPLLGPVATTNLIFLVALFLTTLFSYLFINDLVHKPLPSFVAAAVFTYASYLTLSAYRFGQTEKLSPQWIPLYCLFMFRLAERRGNWKLNLAAGVLCLLTLALTDLQFLMYAVLLTILFAGFSLFRRIGWAEKGWLVARLAALGAIFLAITFFPLFLPMLQEGVGATWLIPGGDQSKSNSRDLVDFIIPTLDNPGYVALALALFGLVRGWRNIMVRFWLIAALVFGLFSLGPVLQLVGNDTGLPLPYKILNHLPILSAGRDPERFFTVYLLGLSVLTAWGLAGLFEMRWFSSGGARRGLTAQAVVAGLVITTTLSGFMLEAGQARLIAPDWPAFYTDVVAKEPDNYAILELPLFTSKGRQEDTYQAFQAIHHKYRFGGWLARDHKLDNPNNFVKHAVLFRDLFLVDQPDQLANLDPARDVVPRTDLARLGLPILNYYKVHYIVYYLDALWGDNKKRADDLVQTVLGRDAQPIYQDASMLVYPVPEANVPANVITLDAGVNWHGAESDANGTRRWYRVESQAPAELLALNLSDQPRPAKLQLDLASISPDRPVEIALNGQPVATVRLEQAQSLKNVQLDLKLKPGNNVITFFSPGPYQRAPDGRLLAFMIANCRLQ